MKRVRMIDYKIGLLSVKYLPVIMFLIMWVHVGLALFDINGVIADTVVGCAIIPSLLILSISRMLNFCWLHKSLTLYSLCIDLCINWQRYVGFFYFTTILRFIMFTVGLILFILLIYNFRNYRKKCVSLKSLIQYAKTYKEIAA